MSQDIGFEFIWLTAILESRKTPTGLPAETAHYLINGSAAATLKSITAFSWFSS